MESSKIVNTELECGDAGSVHLQTDCLNSRGTAARLQSEACKSLLPKPFHMFKHYLRYDRYNCFYNHKFCITTTTHRNV